jgi:hypothetical protein
MLSRPLLGRKEKSAMQNDVVAPGENIIDHLIGIIHIEHIHPEKTPIQPVYAAGCKSKNGNLSTVYRGS